MRWGCRGEARRRRPTDRLYAPRDSGAAQGDAVPEIPDLPDRSTPVIAPQPAFVSDRAAWEIAR